MEVPAAPNEHGHSAFVFASLSGQDALQRGSLLLLPSDPAVLRLVTRFSYEQYTEDILEFENDKYQIVYR